MIAIDTNVLLRYLLQDDDVQSPRANRLIEGKNKVLITDIVLVETMWTLKGKKYKLAKDELLFVVDQLFKASNIVFEDGQAVWRALHTIRNTKPIKIGSKKKDADFADALVLEKAKYDCDRKGNAFDGLYSFDKAAQQINGIKKL